MGSVLVLREDGSGREAENPRDIGPPGRDTEPVFVLTARGLRRAVIIAAGVLVVAGIGLGAYVAGRSSSRSSSSAAARTVLHHRDAGKAGAKVAPTTIATSPTTTVATTTTTTTSPVPGPDQSTPGEGEPWQPAPPALLTAIDAWTQTLAYGPEPSVPAGYGVWISQDPNDPQWYAVDVVAPANLNEANSAGAPDAGVGIVENTGSAWRVLGAITNQAFGCYGPDGNTNDVVVPTSVLADFGVTPGDC